MSAPPLRKVLEAEKEYNELLRAYWQEYNFLTFQWWLLILFSIIPAVIWWIYVDRKRLFEIMTFGLIIGTIASILDSIGSNAMLWTYKVRVSPYLTPQFYPFNLALVIVPYMFAYQWSKSTLKFFIFSVAIGAIQTFLSEPLLVWLGIYEEFAWKHYYSFPIYVALGMFVWWVMKYLKHKIPQYK